MHILLPVYTAFSDVLTHTAYETSVVRSRMCEKLLKFPKRRPRTECCWVIWKRVEGVAFPYDILPCCNLTSVRRQPITSSPAKLLLGDHR